MNKKDVETIGYLMATCKTKEEFERGMFQLDPRIEDELIIQTEISGNDEATSERFAELMTEEYGPNWYMSKIGRAEGRQKELWQRAHDEIRA